MRANSYMPVQEWEHKKPQEKIGTMMSTCSKAWLQIWELFRGIHTSFIIISTGKWEVIYFYNLAYIYGELSLTII